MKLIKGHSYYCLIGDNWHLTMAVIKIKYVGPANYKYNSDLVFVEHNVDGYVHRFGADTKDIYPLDMDILKAVLHNERQTRRIIEHPKTYDLSNAKERVLGWIATLNVTDQKALAVKFHDHFPLLVKKGQYLTSKFKITDWHELMHDYFRYKYPKIEVPHER